MEKGEGYYARNANRIGFIYLSISYKNDINQGDNLGVGLAIAPYYPPPR